MKRKSRSKEKTLQWSVLKNTAGKKNFQSRIIRKMDTLVITYKLQYAYKHIPKIQRFRSFIEEIVIGIENRVFELHEESKLFPDEAVMKILDSLCVSVYDISANLKRSNPNEKLIEFEYETILFSLLNIRKYYRNFNLPVPLLEN